MDIVAHGLWAGLGVVAMARRWRVDRAQAAGAVALAVLPDLGQMLAPIAWWWFGGGSWQALREYAVATPATEPWLPPAVQFWSHQLHCVTHSAIVVGLVTLAAWAWWRRALVPIAGWWSHVIIDVFTHSRDFYPSPVLYPITQRGFDGIAWNTPWLMVLNYAALAVAGAWLWRHRDDAAR